jgi:hypothetical protein
MDEENQYWKQPTVSSIGSAARKLPAPTSRAPADPNRSTWIASACRAILSSYRRDDFADPDGYLVQLGMVLERYPDDIIKHVTSPITGIQRHCKFPPSIAEVVEMCEDEQARQVRIRELAQLRPAPRAPRVKQHRANVLLRTDAYKYQEMVDKANDPKTDPADWRWDENGKGIWVVLGWLK